MYPMISLETLKENIKSNKRQDCKETLQSVLKFFTFPLHPECGLTALSEYKREDGGVAVASGQSDESIVQPHYLTGQAQPDTAAFRPGGEERDEYLFPAFLADRHAVVADIDHDTFCGVDFCCDADVAGACLYRIPEQVDEDSGYLFPVGVEKDVFGLFGVGADDVS